MMKESRKGRRGQRKQGGVRVEGRKGEMGWRGREGRIKGVREREEGQEENKRRGEG